MGVGSGYGKVILFNEHFVVHGIPAIAAGVGLSTDASVRRWAGEELRVIDQRKGTEGYSESKKEQQKEAIERILKEMGIDPKENPLEIRVGGSLPTYSGIGASAANCVAIARAVSDQFGLECSDERINEIAYEAEKAYAGTPSGIDNTVATYGGLIWFKRGEKPVIEKLSVKRPFEIVMGNTGKVADTKAVVEGVRERKERFPEGYNPIFRASKELVGEARKALEDCDLNEVGKLMNDNHKLLQRIEVSSKELDYLVELARKNGALGAKLTGGGVGGCMVALTPGKDLQERVAGAIEREGYEVLRTRIG
ncbi:MAG TPA: mevalonate kinase [Thermoplasmata archaeon]|nr:mevalonate kinase [Thermoplasmata archaeon]